VIVGSAANAADVPEHTTSPFSMIACRSASFGAAGLVDEQKRLALRFQAHKAAATSRLSRGR
jgi:hypothetical protein